MMWGKYILFLKRGGQIFLKRRNLVWKRFWRIVFYEAEGLIKTQTLGWVCYSARVLKIKKSIYCFTLIKTVSTFNGRYSKNKRLKTWLLEKTTECNKRFYYIYVIPVNKVNLYFNQCIYMYGNYTRCAITTPFLSLSLSLSLLLVTVRTSRCSHVHTLRGIRAPLLRLTKPMAKPTLLSATLITDTVRTAVSYQMSLQYMQPRVNAWTK